MSSQIEAWLEEGLRYYSQGDPARALEAWYRILDVEPGHTLTKQYVDYVRQVYHIEAPERRAPDPASSTPPMEQAVVAAPPPAAPTPPASAARAEANAGWELAPAEVQAERVLLDEPRSLPVEAALAEVASAEPAHAAVTSAPAFDEALVDLAPPSSSKAPRTDRVDLEGLALASAVVSEAALAAAPAAAPAAATVPPSFAATSPPGPALAETKKHILGLDPTSDWGDLVESAFDVEAPKTGPVTRQGSGEGVAVSAASPGAPQAAPSGSPPAHPPSPVPGAALPRTGTPAASAATMPPPSFAAPITDPVAPTPGGSAASDGSVPRMATHDPWAPRRPAAPPSPAQPPASGAGAFAVPPRTPIQSPPASDPGATAPMVPPPSLQPSVAPLQMEHAPRTPTTGLTMAGFDPWQGDSVPNRPAARAEAVLAEASQHLDLPPPTPSPLETAKVLEQLRRDGQAPSASVSDISGGFDVDIDLGAPISMSDAGPSAAPSAPPSAVPSGAARSASPSVAPSAPPGVAPSAPPSVAPSAPPSVAPNAPSSPAPSSAPTGVRVEERVSGARMRYNDYSNYDGPSSTASPPPPPPSAPALAVVPPPPAAPMGASSHPAPGATGSDPWAEIDGMAGAVDLDHAPSPSAKLEQVLAPAGGGLAAWPSTPGSATPAAGPEDECEELMRGARELFDLGDFSGSLELVEKALRSNPDHDGARAYMQRNEATLLRMYESKLGNLHKTPRQLVPPDEVIWMNMHHKAGFILSQVDGMMTYDDLLAISGMSRFDTMRILHDLVQQGIIG